MLLKILIFCMLSNVIATGSDSAICFGNLTIDLPVRYLHIQLLRNGENLTESQGPIDVHVEGDCRLRSQIIDNFDGSYILRIRLWSSCPELVVTIRTSSGVQLCNSPFTIRKANNDCLYPEYCDRPKKDIIDWMKENGCNRKHKQLVEDLKEWPVLDFEKVSTTVRKKWADNTHRYTVAICHYQIIDNELSRECYGAYTGFRIFVDEIFTSLLRKMKLPNTEFMVNLGDWPLAKRSDGPLPIVSWCGSKDMSDIVLPTYELMSSVVKSMDTVTLDVHTAKGNKHHRWQDKKDTAIFRGRDSCQLRLDTAKLSEQYPELVDAAITKYFFFNEVEHTPAVESIPFSDFFLHKYVISIDGTVAAYRFPFLLAGDSVIFKSSSKYYEHFYNEIHDGLHYFQFTTPNDLIKKLRLAKTQNFNKTIRAMRQFVMDHLQPLHLYCYYADFITMYTQRLKQMPPKMKEGMERVPKTPDSMDIGQCDCNFSWQNSGEKTYNKKEDL